MTTIWSCEKRPDLPEGSKHAKGGHSSPVPEVSSLEELNAMIDQWDR